MPEGPRIPPVVDPDEAQREALEKVPPRPDGSTRNIFLTLANHPLLLKRFNAFAGTFFLSGELSGRDRELLVLRVASRTGSRYELSQHLEIACDAGLSDAEILSILDRPGAAPLAPPDAELAAAADQLLATGEIEPATWDALAARFSRPALLEVLFVTGFYRMTADFLNVAGVELEEPLPPEFEPPTQT